MNQIKNKQGKPLLQHSNNLFKSLGFYIVFILSIATKYYILTIIFFFRIQCQYQFMIYTLTILFMPCDSYKFNIYLFHFFSLRQINAKLTFWTVELYKYIVHLNMSQKVS